ncbi:MAG: acetate/propionate family kinase [Candidatus Gracilibacteria bacterium]
MRLLVFNAGSSSLRFTLFNEKLEKIYRGHIDALALKTCHYRNYLKNGKEEKTPLKIKNHHEAVLYALRRLEQDGAIKNLKEINLVGHRVVHGGSTYKNAILITKKVIKNLEKLSPLAPLHNPVNLAVIKSAQQILKNAKHYAVFDTAFYSTIPQKAFLYGLPYSYYKKDGVRKFGFQGTSHQFVVSETTKILKNKNLALVTCHIGNGVSVTATKNGKAMDTTMGFTPLEGPIMGTRSGTIDPGLLLHLLKKISQEKLQNILQKESGFLGVSEIGSDVRTLFAKPKSEGTIRTFELFSYQMAKLILSMIAPLGASPDAIVFTAGIGENAYYLRAQICEYLKPLGLKLDQTKNRKNAQVISAKNSKIKVLVLKTDEELAIAKAITKN